MQWEASPESNYYQHVDELLEVTGSRDRSVSGYFEGTESRPLVLGRRAAVFLIALEYLRKYLCRIGFLGIISVKRRLGREFLAFVENRLTRYLY